MIQANSELSQGEQGRRRVLLTQLLQYAVALLLVILALVINLLFRSYLYSTPTPLFFAAVMVSAWYGGIKPGLIATILSTLLINYFFVEPIYSFSVPNLTTLAQLGVFTMAAILISSLNETQRAAKRKAQANFCFWRESEARFSRLVESNIIGIIVADLDGPILEANDSFLEMVGYTQEELRTGKLRWREMTPPEFIEVSDQAVQQLVTTGTCTPFEKEYFRKDGSRVPVLHGATITGERTVIGFVVNLSQHKQAQERERSLHTQVQAAKEELEAVLASINDQFLVLDDKWRYTYVNDRVVEVVGIPREELLGKCLWDLFPELVGSQFYDEVHRAATEQKIIHFEFFFSHWQRWFDNHIYPNATGVSIFVTEITASKQTQAKLQRANQRLQTLIDVCPVAIGFFDPQGIVKLWNRAAERIFGWSAEEAIGKFMPTVPHRRQEFISSLETVLRGRSLDALEVQHQAKDGRMVDLEIWANLTHDAEGNPGCIGIAWDLTERKRVETALRTSEERYRLLVATSTAVVWTTDAHGAFICPQPSWEDYTGQTWEEYAGWGWLEMFHPQDHEFLTAKWKSALANQSLYEVEARLWHASSGEYRYITARAVPLLNADGSVREWIGMDTDIHDRKQAESALRQSQARFQVLVSNMPGMIYSYYPDCGSKSVFTYVSSGSLELLELEPQTIIEDANRFFSLIHPDDWPSFENSVAIAVKDCLLWEWEGRLITPSGKLKWIQGRSRPEKTASGNVWDGLFLDITDRKQAEIEREQLLLREKAAREQAQAANRIKDEFLAVLSHELRTPLNPILGWAKLLRSGRLDAQKTAYALETIERNAQLQTQLIGDLLDVSRILQGKISLNITAVDLETVIIAALETVCLAAQAKSIHIETIFNSAVGMVAGDSARLQQIIWNLLSNAVKFTEAGGRVQVSLQRVGTQAQISISDTGRGISPEFLPYVFDYFRQADGATTRKFGGLGLGLAIVRHLTELHGGTVTVYSSGEERGATFTVSIPLIKTEVLDKEVDSAASSDVSAIKCLANIRILIVDDDADTRDYISFVLEQAGAEVIVATSVTEAMQLLEQSIPDILVSDIDIPDVDGYALIQQVRKLPPEGGGNIQAISYPGRKAIALTAYAGEMNEKQAMKVGFQRHISKPVEPEELIAAILELVKN